MKLASFRADGRDRIGCETAEGLLIDVADLMPAESAPRDMIELIERGDPVIDQLRQALDAPRPDGVEVYRQEEVEWLPPVLRPTKIVCLALNNRSLDAIKIKAPTDHPAFFLKPATALTGHRTAIRMKARYGFTHPEPELAVIIGRRLSQASSEDAMAAVFGYSILNDVTCVGMREEDSFALRYFRPEGGGLVEDVAYTSYPGRYKASDTFAPMGPFIVTRDEIPDPGVLRILCRMGDRIVAADHARNYVWSVADALSQISQTMTLLPGDVVSMGTAVGGDQQDANAPHIPGVTRCNLNGFVGEVAVEISGLGILTNTVAVVG